MEESSLKKQKDSNDNILVIMEDDKFFSKDANLDEIYDPSEGKTEQEERLSFSVDDSKPDTINNVQSVKEYGSDHSKQRRRGGKRHEKHKEEYKKGILQEVVDEFSPSESSHDSSNQSETSMHRQKINKNEIGRVPTFGVRGSDERLERKYMELHQLLQDQFAQQQRILQKQQIAMTQKIMKKYKLSGEGYVGQMNLRPSSANLHSRHERLSVKQRPSSATNTRPSRARGRRRYRSGEPHMETSTQTGSKGKFQNYNSTININIMSILLTGT